MLAEIFQGPLAAMLFLLVILIYLAFKLVQTSCSDSTVGKAVRGIFRRWFRSKQSDGPTGGQAP